MMLTGLKSTRISFNSFKTSISYKTVENTVVEFQGYDLSPRNR